MFWTRAILWKIIKVLGYLIGIVRYFPARKRNIFFVPYLTRPHVCRHTFCSNMASSGMAPKTLQYIMGHSEIGITLNVYTHVATGDATEEFRRLASMMNNKHYTIYDLENREAGYFVPQMDTEEDKESWEGIEEYLEKKAM